MKDFDLNHLSSQCRDLAKSIPQHPEPRLEQHLLSEFRSHHRRRARKWMYLTKVAAVLIVASALYLSLVRRARSSAPAQTHRQDADAVALQGFVPLPYGESGVPLGEAIVVRIQLRPSDLTALGAPVPLAETREPVVADVLIGQDGVARAIHFVP